MAIFWILLCTTIVSGLSWAEVPYKRVKLNIFSDEKWSFEAMVRGQYGFTRDIPILSKIETALLRSSNDVSDSVPLRSALISQLSQKHFWKASFEKSFANEFDRAMVKNEVSRIHASLVAIQDLIQGTQSASPSNLDTIAEKIRRDFFEMIEIFANPNSTLKKYPLIGSPPLIAMSFFIESFNQSLVNTPKMSCAVRNVLLDYRSRAVDARLDKLQHDLYFMPQIRSRVMAWPYNKNGYRKSDTLKCGGACNEKSKSMWTANSEADFRPNSQEIMYRCLKDDYSTNEFYINNYQNYDCAEGYAGLVRHRVEEMFSVQSFDTLCGKENPTASTGPGYFTIRLKHLTIEKESNGNDPELDGEDPFFELFINGELANETDWNIENVKHHDFNDTFVWKLDTKNTPIEIKVWDKDGGVQGDGNDLILSTKGTVDDFLTNGLRKGNQGGSFFKTYLETVSFWQNEKENNNEDKMSLNGPKIQRQTENKVQNSQLPTENKSQKTLLKRPPNKENTKLVENGIRKIVRIPQNAFSTLSSFV